MFTVNPSPLTGGTDEIVINSGWRSAKRSFQES